MWVVRVGCVYVVCVCLCVLRVLCVCGCCVAACCVVYVVLCGGLFALKCVVLFSKSMIHVSLCRCVCVRVSARGV